MEGQFLNSKTFGLLYKLLSCKSKTKVVQIRDEYIFSRIASREDKRKSFFNRKRALSQNNAKFYKISFLVVEKKKSKKDSSR